MESNPSRANCRISSIRSHAFFSRLRRSILCTFDSCTSLIFHPKEKPTRHRHLAGGFQKLILVKLVLYHDLPCASRCHPATTKHAGHHSTHLAHRDHLELIQEFLTVVKSSTDR